MSRRRKSPASASISDMTQTSQQNKEIQKLEKIIEKMKNELLSSVSSESEKKAMTEKIDCKLL